MKKSLFPKQNEEESRKKKKQLSYATKEHLLHTLKQYFGHSEFRGKQLEAIQSVLSGRDCFCLMPTGGGKSMCYQIPALAKSGLVLVVSPLIALMEDQVMSLKEKGIAANFYSSTQKQQIKDEIKDELSSGNPALRLLYVTPELIEQAWFIPKLIKLYTRGLLNLIAIDEAHCISSWGHDFRPSYRKLSSLRKHLPDVPLLALTATAIPKVQKEIITSLRLQHPVILMSSFNRPNIYYEVRYKDLLEDIYSDLFNEIKSFGDNCSIVYCHERTTCDEVSSHLQKKGLRCAAYHAGLNTKRRTSVLNDWFSSEIQVVVATVAFGMGIDRSNVRLVCHFNVPKSMEGFYQESGRAGRDQLPSKSLLYYGIDDRKKMEFLISKPGNSKSQSSDANGISPKKTLEAFKQIVEYCEESNCRRKKILETFGEQVSISLCGKSCDACRYPNVVAKHLKDLASVSSMHRSSHILISSCSGTAAEDQFTEFWNRDDEASGSDEDISDSDDDAAVLKGLAGSKSSSKAGLDEKIRLLQRAEEDYYGNNTPSKQKSLDKKAVPEALREASKQRLLNALKQTEQRLGSLKIGKEAAASKLENECYHKYGKIGRTFYNSQMASTMRWLSNASFSEISERLGISANQRSDACDSHLLPTESSSPLLDPVGKDLDHTEDHKEEPHGIAGSQDRQCVSGTKIAIGDVALPAIPSFSEFIKKEGNEGSPNAMALPPIPSFSEFMKKEGKVGNQNATSTSTKRVTTLQRDATKRKKL